MTTAGTFRRSSGSRADLNLRGKTPRLEGLAAGWALFSFLGCRDFKSCISSCPSTL
jgi:hypothetical protein